MSLHGRTMLVTGAGSGIGFETARALAAAGARVLVGCRTESSAETTLRAIRARHPSAELTPLVLDLASFESIRRVVASLEVPTLDAVICNAGLFTPRYELTEDGLERTVGVCHFGHFLLVTSLLDRLGAAAPSRVVMVSSESHRHPKTLRFDRFPLDERHYNGLVAYGQAKLCNVLFANELTRLHGGRGITANSLHPGSMIGTSIFRRSVAAKALALAVRPFTKTIAEGAATTVYCAAAPELEGVGGRYFVDCREKSASAFARSEAAAKELWERSVEVVGAR
ncbi:MAG: SDR family oxidoreductase [Polyangiaceae bacterium]|nr:SDR family oxidoreductase [Polyangiaceae bacterium]